MNNQKKKRSKSNKKGKPTKDQTSLQPLGTLMHEIDNLKQELRSIKSKKQLSKIQHSDLYHSPSQQTVTSGSKRLCSPQNPINFPHHENNENTGLNSRIELISINYQSKDKKLKLDIQLNKLRKIIQRGRADHIATQSNIVFSLINLYNDQIANQFSRVRESYESQQADRDQFKIKNNYQVYKEKYKALAKSNLRLEEEVCSLRERLSSILQCQSKQLQRSHGTDPIETVPIFPSPKFQEEFNILYQENQSLAEINSQLRDSIMELTEKVQAACQKVRIYERNIEKKESQLVLMEEDVNYLRIQSERFREQKKEMDAIYEETSNKYRELKGTLESEVSRLEREKSKYQNELKLRRHQSESILQIESQKNHLYKEVEYLREELTKKGSESSQIRSLLQQNQKKVLYAESQLYRVKADHEKLERNLDYSKGEINSLYIEVQELQMANDKHKTVFKGKANREEVCQDKLEKMKALEQIHSMIKRHKQEVGNFS